VLSGLVCGRFLGYKVCVTRRLTVGVGILLAAALCGVLVACGGGHAAAPTTTVSRPHSKPLPANAIKVHWKREALVPAPHSGRVCIVTYKTGHICAAYHLGEIPATALKQKLRKRGYVVVNVP
jgi:hypothetical protein